MAYKISQSCTGCDICRTQCPTGAIKVKDNQTWIDPNLCNNCEGYYPEPQCVIHCPISSPVPAHGKKGRYKLNERPPPVQIYLPMTKPIPLLPPSSSGKRATY